VESDDHWQATVYSGGASVSNGLSSLPIFRTYFKVRTPIFPPSSLPHYQPTDNVALWSFFAGCSFAFQV